MTNYTKIFILFLFAATAFKANAQTNTNTSSPYSRFGIGDVDPQLLPQNAGMGGIGVATNVLGGFSTINFINPAAYGAINLTTIDVAVFGSSLKLSRDGQGSQRSNNFTLNHLAFAIPVSKKSALSFGLVPYSRVGYNYRQSQQNFGTGFPSDTNAVNFNYSGEGGLNKAYLGYGFGIGKHLLIGANVSYLFGNLKNFRTTSIPSLYGTFDTRIENSSSIKGLNYDYGLQYMFDFSENNRVTLGYSGSANTKLSVQNSEFVSHFTTDVEGNENIPLDSVVKNIGPKAKLQLPLIHRFGLSYKMGEKLLIGADYTTGKWSDLTIAGTDAGLKNSQTFNVGAQWTPNINKLGNYFALVDYRVGFIYNDTYLHVNDLDIKQYGFTVGLGLPLRPGPTNTSFYKINVSAEIGTRGRLAHQLVKENYINIRLGFTLNDKWFQRYRFD
ncbi:hypothetical protein DJ568_12520 [Mucilaginibacter hurinus]|uniref:Aromatic hydrocarbon degradation protein n=1 Tax=Mucilaginibacter hurinus TaxID=2201324 RepID=A0A367GME3_9SPHI|nr:hypothetical protein [Mucilaginibacter hurinus]RCH54637.1 hypothetical protein DJ568_12520 [Mucilaginibacter hurinus]